jgi:hypothetical protein
MSFYKIFNSNFLITYANQELIVYKPERLRLLEKKNCIKK